MERFELDPRIAKDTAPVAELPLSTVRLMRDANYPWLLLVPKRAGAIELTDLGAHDRIGLMEEIALASDALRAVTPCDKLNVAAIGNMVSQLHVHVVARRKGDAAWPKPVWGHAPAAPYDPEQERALIAAIAERLAAFGRTG
jgi:diadenosine tetraphosphate (Ap4A) HIT family hydrolase